MVALEKRFDYSEAYPFDTKDLGKPLWEFNMEQQAEIFRRCHDPKPSDPPRKVFDKTIGGCQTQPPKYSGPPNYVPNFKGP